MAYPQLVVPTLIFALVALCPLAWWLATALSGRRWVALAAAVALSVAVALALARPGLRSDTADWSQLSAVCTITDPRPLTAEALLNLLLLAPFAALAVLALGRPIPVIALAVLTSAGIEAVQGALSVGTCDSSDLFRNATGAVVAAVLAAAVRAVPPRARNVPRADRRDDFQALRSF